MATAILAISACGQEAGTFAEPKQSPDVILRLVTEHVTSTGTVMDNYELEGLSFDYADREWNVFFNGKSLLIGDHFSVVVSDDNTQDLTVVPGR